MFHKPHFQISGCFETFIFFKWLVYNPWKTLRDGSVVELDKKFKENTLRSLQYLWLHLGSPVHWMWIAGFDFKSHSWSGSWCLSILCMQITFRLFWGMWLFWKIIQITLNIYTTYSSSSASFREIPFFPYRWYRVLADLITCLMHEGHLVHGPTHHKVRHSWVLQTFINSDGFSISLCPMHNSWSTWTKMKYKWDLFY